MKNKIIYVDFIKKRKISFPIFIIYRIFHFIFNKFRNNSNQEINDAKNNRLFS